MDVERIRALAQILSETGLTLLEVAEGESRVRLERAVAQPLALLPPPSAPQPLPAPEPAASAGDFNNVQEIKSPMVGVFYAAPSPESPPFVKRGDRVKRGDVLCIIEAMKLLNEITAEVDGEIADICVENGQVVEFSQTLFKVY